MAESTQPQPGQDMHPPADGYPQPALAPERNPKRRQKIVLAVFLVVVLGFFGVIWLATRHNAETAKVGDCMEQTGPDSLKVVGCGDPKATFTVVGRVEDKTQVEAGLSACRPFQDKGAEQAYWSGEQGKKGLVLCLARKS